MYIIQGFQMEIEEKLNELSLRTTQLATCQENLNTANTEIVERNKIIEVSVISPITVYPG